MTTEEEIFLSPSTNDFDLTPASVESTKMSKKEEEGPRSIWEIDLKNLETVSFG